jgi:hypothetical protein
MNPIHFDVDTDGNVLSENKQQVQNLVTGRRGGIFTFFSSARRQNQ